VCSTQIWKVCTHIFSLSPHFHSVLPSISSVPSSPCSLLFALSPFPSLLLPLSTPLSPLCSLFFLLFSPFSLFSLSLSPSFPPYPLFLPLTILSLPHFILLSSPLLPHHSHGTRLENCLKNTGHRCYHFNHLQLLLLPKLLAPPPHTCRDPE